MHSIALLSTEDLKAYSKCAQLYSIIYDDALTHFTILRAKRILRKEGDINFLIPLDSSVWEEDIKGGTVLHIAWNSQNSEIWKELLDLGGDFTIKNKCGCTALHCAFRMYRYQIDKLPKDQDDSCINLILSAHVKLMNFSNPYDNDGFSHFHIACMVNHVKVIEFFLENGVDVNQTVCKEKQDYPGFTPLHFAIKCYNVETAEVLLKYGADISIRNGYGLTPLDQLINQKIELLESIITLTEIEQRKLLENRVKIIDRMIFILLSYNFLDKVQMVGTTGLSSFHIACTMQDPCAVENLLSQVKDINHCVNIDSPMWPGYTALHFAAHCNISIMMLLHERGASIDVKNAEGLTPFDICVKRGHIGDIHSAILLKTEWASILFSDNKTRLENFILAMRDAIQLNHFLRKFVDDINMTLPNESPLWPGCTPLHLAVMISKKYVEDTDRCSLSEEESILAQIEVLLKRGADVTQKDTSGRTPLHYAFRQEKAKVSKLLRSHHRSSVNHVDGDNLSHLHIACSENDENLVEKILSSSNIDVNIPYAGEKDVQNIKPGWTPLNCVSYNEIIKQMLLQHGAKIFSSEEQCDRNTLHSACYKGDKNAVERLLELGANIDLRLDDGRTSLHLAVNRNSPEVVELLLQRGADLVAKDEDGNTPLSRVFERYCSASTENVNFCKCKRSMVSILKQHEELQRRMERETGMTMLHIACYMLDVEEVRRQLNRGVKVDTQVQEDSKVWPGCTALHVLMIKVKIGLSKEEISSNVSVITELFLENGADVTLANADGDTSIHILQNSNDKDSVSRTELLLKHHRDFRINPIDGKGVSHFHLAVMLNCIEVVEKFLEHGVNVNQSPDFFAEPYNVGTPLHMAIDNVKRLSDMRIVELLLKHGADVSLEDAFGRSALHKAFSAGSLRLPLIEKLLSFGADINREDSYGLTPLEMLLCSKNAPVEDLQFFLIHGCRVNAHNPIDDEGYLGTVFSKNDKAYRDLLFEEIIKAPDVAKVNELGRTIIHNVVAVTKPAISSMEYVHLFNRFKGFCCDIDHQDRAGQTALHLAAQFGNDKAIWALLHMGADLNIVDSKGKSAFSYAVESCVKCEEDQTEHYHAKAIQVFVKQVHKLKCIGLDVSQLNNSLLAKSSKIVSFTGLELLILQIYHEYHTTKNFTITPLSMTVEDFLSETNAVIKYSRMSESSRDIIDKVFESLNHHYDTILPILRLQHRKAVTRFQLIETISSFKLLVGYPLPDLCAQMILKFLNTADLKSIVAAANLVA